MTSRVERIGSVVRRPTAFWSPAVHDLLRQLEAIDFPAPRVITVESEVEVLSWIEGESGADGWAKVVPEPGLRRWARFLRRYHDAIASFQPPAKSVWSSGTGTCSEGEVVCHGDFGPWNGVWQGDDIVGLIDWDHARPAAPLFDVAYALEYVAPFRDDEECVRSLRYPSPPDRRRRIEVFCEAYGIAVPDDVTSLVAEEQRTVFITCEALGRHGIEPQATWIREGHLDELQSRIRWTETLDL
jgi:aminoglycoside phosphotransferase (APT) family kinase protein